MVRFLYDVIMFYDKLMTNMYHVKNAPSHPFTFLDGTAVSLRLRVWRTWWRRCASGFQASEPRALLWSSDDGSVRIIGSLSCAHWTAVVRCWIPWVKSIGVSWRQHSKREISWEIWQVNLIFGAPGESVSRECKGFWELRRLSFCSWISLHCEFVIIQS